MVGIQRSSGGVPKLPVERVRVGAAGLEGDWQRNRKHHGGPMRALCLYSQDLIDALVREGHQVAPGALGENLTLAGIDWRLARPGARLRLGEVLSEVTSFTAPCRNIAYAFRDRRFTRVSEKNHPGWSRLYARVLEEGTIAVGDVVSLDGPA